MARTAATARKSAPVAPVAPVVVPAEACTITEVDGLCTITFRTDGTYPVNDSGKSWNVARLGAKGYAPTRTESGVVVQLTAYRVIPSAQRPK